MGGGGMGGAMGGNMGEGVSSQEGMAMGMNMGGNRPVRFGGMGAPPPALNMRSAGAGGQSTHGQQPGQPGMGGAAGPQGGGQPRIGGMNHMNALPGMGMNQGAMSMGGAGGRGIGGMPVRRKQRMQLTCCGVAFPRHTLVRLVCVCALCESARPLRFTRLHARPLRFNCPYPTARVSPSASIVLVCPPPHFLCPPLAVLKNPILSRGAI